MRQAIGIDIGGTRLRVARVSEAGIVGALEIAATPSTAERVLIEVDRMIAALGLDVATPIGIGIPGRVDSAKGTIFSGGFVDLSGPPLKQRLKAGQHPLFIANDAAMALTAEAAIGAAKGRAHVAMLTIGTGIGGAIMEGGRVLRGRATAGQLGHVTVDVAGRDCLCGRRGCVETTSSGTALRRLIAAAGLDAATGIDALLARSDDIAKTIISDWALPLRAAIDSLVAVLDPEVVVLGGGLGRAACRALERFPALSPWYQCPVVLAELGDDAGVIGAALGALEEAR